MGVTMALFAALSPDEAETISIIKAYRDPSKATSNSKY